MRILKSHYFDIVARGSVRMEQLREKTILLVEDEAIIAMSESRMLGRNGYTVLVAGSGGEAVEIAGKRNDLDLILMDIDLGSGMDGTEAAEMILKIRDLPILFLSSHTEPEIVQKTENITSIGYVVKNSGDTVLLASIRMAFRIHEAHMQNMLKTEELEAANEELNSAIEELEETNVELQSANEQLTKAKKDLEMLLAEQRRAESALQKSESEFRSLFEASPAGAALLKDRKFLKVNTQMCEMMGYEPGELLGVSTRLFYLNDEDYKRSGIELYGLIKRNGRGMLEMRLVRKDGAVIDVLLSGSPIDSDDISAGIAVTVLDFTERRRAEDALMQSESEFRSLFEASSVGATLVKNRHFLKVNTQMCEMMGYAPEELLGQSTRLFYLNDGDFDRCGMELYGQMEREGRGTLEMRLVRKDGIVIETMLSASPLDRNDVSAGIAVTVLDFTKRKRAEMALAQSESEFRSIFDASPAGIALVSDRILIKVNAEMCTMSGYPEEELIGQSTRILYPDDEEYARVGEELYGHVCREGIGKMETILRRKNGTLYNVLLCASGVEHRDAPNSITIAILDISDRKRAEEAVSRALAEKEALLHELQHRVKNNLAMIIGIIDLETERVADETMRGILDDLKSRIDSLAFLYAILFKSNTLMSVTLGDYIESIVHSLEGVYIAGMSPVRIERRYDPVVASAKDATAWGLIVNELLTNALKYAFPSGTPGVIRLELARGNETIDLVVSDNGRGLPDGFDIERWPGLGLLLVKTLAQQLGGTFSFARGRENLFSVSIGSDS